MNLRREHYRPPSLWSRRLLVAQKWLGLIVALGGALGALMADSALSTLP